MPTPLTTASLSGMPNVAHGFFTRHGGVSQGIYASLNCGHGSKDDSDAVSENRARVGAYLGAPGPITANQVHSATAVIAERAWDAQQRPRADAIVTATRGLTLGVLTADCAPVLLADPDAGVVAAAHAGWRGALEGIVEATIAAMVRLGARPERVRGAVGPCIGQPAYEVGWDFERSFIERDAESAGFFMQPGAGARPHFDLPGYVALRLTRAGVLVERAPAPCTFAQDEDFFSYRRSQVRKEPDYGRQISAIVLT